MQCNSEKVSGLLFVVSPAERLRGLRLGTGAAADVGLRQVRVLLRLRFCQGSLLWLGRETVCGNMVTCTEVRGRTHTRTQSRLCFVVDPESVFASSSSAVHIALSSRGVSGDSGAQDGVTTVHYFENLELCKEPTEMNLFFTFKLSLVSPTEITEPH